MENLCSVFSVLRVRLCKFFVQLVIVIHVFACTWFFIACPLNECYGEDSWVTQQGNRSWLHHQLSA